MTTKSDGGNRTRRCTVIYRALMEVFEARRRELGLSMNTNEVGLNDLAGAADGYYAKMIFADTPSGRQARWETVDEFATVLFGQGYSIQIVPGDLNRKTLTALSELPKASEKSINIRHWRHSKYFRDLGSAGGKARKESLTRAQRIAIAKKANRASQRARKARRQGAEHKRANEARAT